MISLLFKDFLLLSYKEEAVSLYKHLLILQKLNVRCGTPP